MAASLVSSTQPSRELHSPDSKLFFASFDPRTALSGEDVPDLRKPSIGEGLPPSEAKAHYYRNNSRRHESTPKARLEEGIRDDASGHEYSNYAGE